MTFSSSKGKLCPGKHCHHRPPPPSPHQAASLVLTVLGPSVSDTVQGLSFCAWLISLSMMSSRFIHAVHSPANGHLGCFILATVNKVVNISVQHLSVPQLSTFGGVHSGLELLGLCLNLLRNYRNVFHGEGGYIFLIKNTQ